MTVRPIFAWYDLWVGAFWDRDRRRLYVFPVPMLGVVLDFGESEHDRWLAECAKECRCCPRCRTHPCGGVTAGGVCDDLDCDCGQHDPGFYEVGEPDDDDDEDDGQARLDRELMELEDHEEPAP